MTADGAWGTDEYVDLPGIRLRVRRSGSGAPLLLINGIGAALEMWEPLALSLNDRELIAFDLPGAGRSSLPAWPLRMRQLAAIVSNLIGALGHRQVDVLGYSFGGVVAQELAYRSPARVRRLVLCATTPGPPGVAPSPLVVALMLTPARYYSAALGSLILPRVAGGRTARDADVLRAGLTQRLMAPPSLRGYVYQLSATVGWSSHRWLAQVPHKTLVMHGDDDRVAPLANAHEIARKLPRGRLHVVDGGGHLFLIDDPEVTMRPIADFLDEDDWHRST